MTSSTLQSRIKEQFPSLFITLVTVLIGLVLADLVAEARARMQLWPLDLATLRTWLQLSTNGLSALVAWVIYSHLGISRRHIPTLADAIIAFGVPIVLLMGTSFVGLANASPWFYFASAFLFISVLTPIWHVRMLREERELVGFDRILRPTGFVGILASGVAFYAAAGWADQHHWLSPLLEILFSASGPPAAFLTCHVFLRDWRAAIEAADTTAE